MSDEKNDEKIEIEETPFVKIPEEEHTSEDEFVEIPVELCSSLYGSLMEIVCNIRYGKCNPLPATRVEAQGKIIYEILKRYKVSIGNFDIALLLIGAVGDWKTMRYEEVKK